MPELERVMGIEPTLAAWEAAVLPLNYTRSGRLILFTLRPVRQLSARSRPSPSERIVDAAEHRGLAAAETDVHVADDEGTRHAAYVETRGGVQFREGAGDKIWILCAGV